MTATWSGAAYSCQCPSGYAANADGTACTATSFVTTAQTAYSTYSSVSLTSSGQVVQQTVSSAYLTARFIPDLYACTQSGSPAACQRIANQCALVYGDPKHPICLAYGAYKTTAMPTLLVTPLIQDPGATPIDSVVASVAVIVYATNGTVAETLDWATWVARLGKVPTTFAITVGRSQTVACAADAAAAAFPVHLFELVATTVHGTRVPVWARVAAGQYVRRFFLWDALVLDGVGSRAATHVTLTMGMSASGGYLAPVVTVTHAESLTLASAPLTIATEYAMDTSRVWAGLNITFPLVVLSLVFLWTVRLSARTRRNRRGTQFVLDIAWAVKYVTVLTGMVGPFLFWCAMAAAWYFYLFVTYQTTTYVWLPPKSDYAVIVWMLAVAMVVQAAYVAGAVWEQAAATVLLVDWEPGQGKGGGAAPAAAGGVVSAWRRLHVAKKWSEITVYRRVWTAMTLLVTVAAVPAQGDVLLQIAEDALVFGGLAIAQYATMTLLVERFYHSAPMNFVDLLSLANVSILTMRHGELDGYYLHGKSVFPYADADMATLVAQMHRETSDAVTRRGLLAHDDVVFAAWWAPAFRAVYESIVAMSGSATPGNGVWMEPKVGGGGGGGSARAGRARAAPVVVDSRVPPEKAQWEAVNALATRLLDQNLKDQRYQLIQRTIVAKWLGQIPDADAATSLLSPESGPAFLGMMWAGIELDVLMLVLLVYLVIAWASGGHRVVAALVAILVDTALRRARKWYGMRTVAQTAYLDLRFMG
ncbi:hypothetical protein AMAG_01456 [Allomyces macrogynus ATCC 38327]|uniref:Uncharacterized protein n=1 Tax=Allomyces macrogynus (strain ATCC 38327) TaxID=578462 RepID=A0A0L0RZI8_ALLM3|nr:hypothetical protein AMAG_01456 [Allomyces macrogynus ATCC 38327]|eukprot:KNE55565.1 hypothetical protein AMAG_01456 [Allomyces macrogynus ATCC 38327]